MLIHWIPRLNKSTLSKNWKDFQLPVLAIIPPNRCLWDPKRHTKQDFFFQLWEELVEISTIHAWILVFWFNPKRICSPVCRVNGTYLLYKNILLWGWKEPVFGTGFHRLQQEHPHCLPSWTEAWYWLTITPASELLLGFNFFVVLHILLIKVVNEHQACKETMNCLLA